MVHSQIPFKEQETIHIFTQNGKLLHQFGQSSGAFYALVRHIPPYKTSSTLLTIYQDAYFEMDFADFQIRKYSNQGKTRQVFGVKPAEYRSPISTNYQALKQQMVTPDVLQQLKKFNREELSKCSVVSGIISLHPGVICTHIQNQYKSGFTKREYFNFYDLAGNLIANEIAFKDFTGFAYRKRAQLMIAPPHNLILVLFLDEWGEDIRKLKLIWLNLKTSSETNENA